MIREDFLHFIWEHNLYRKEHLCTTCGKKLEIIQPGIRNIHAGPDYLHARIRAGSLIWAGNVEIHSSSYDWIRHGHQRDPSYNNVILHVVSRFTGEVYNSTGNHVFTCIITFPGQIYQRYHQLTGNRSPVHCGPHIWKVPDSLKLKWLMHLSGRRLHEKSGTVFRILKDQRLSREETIFRTIATGFGLPNNTFPFLLLSSRIPAPLVLELRDSLQDLEALLFGHSGLLDSSEVPSTYVERLRNSYGEVKKALATCPVPGHIWHFHRIRPAAFPTVRLALFASLLHQRLPLEEAVLRTSSLPELEQLFRVKASGFWESHYLFDRVSPPDPKFLGTQSVRLLIINAVIPYLYALGKAEKQKSYRERAKELLFQAEAESNYIIKNWIKFGVKPRTAMETQGLIHLYQRYCSQRRCLDCLFGAFILEKT